MGDYADAVFECFGVIPRERIEAIFDPYTFVVDERPSSVVIAIEKLGYGEEGLLCERLRELPIGYAFFHCGDHEHTPVTWLYVPGVGDWRGEADADGGVLVRAGVLDCLSNRARAQGLGVIAEQIDRTSARSLRHFIDEHQGTAPPFPNTSSVDDLRAFLAEHSTFTYVRPNERYLVVLAVTYDHESDPTDTGERIASPRDAAHWALELTRDAGSADTQWAVFDAEVGEWTTFEQSEIKEA